MSSAATPADDESIVDRFQKFYRDYVAVGRDGDEPEMAKLVKGYPSEKRSLYINYDELWTFDEKLASDLLNNPQQMLDYAEEALRLYDLPVDISLGQAHVRVAGLDKFPPTETFLVSDVSPSERKGTLTAVEGQITKVAQRSGEWTEIAFECQRCGTNTPIPQRGTEMQEPHQCQGCERQGPFRINSNRSTDRDIQLIRLQQPPEEQSGIDQPAKLDLVMADDLVGAVSPGDRVTLGVILETVTDEKNSAKTSTYNLRGEVNAVHHHDTDFEDLDITQTDEQQIKAIAEKAPMTAIKNSILPTHHGDELVKEAIGLMLFGSGDLRAPDGSTVRGRIHLFLVGDPSTGKSRMLEYAKDLVPRSVYTGGGKSATAAGLTSAAVQDDFGDGGWTIEGGALVKAAGGICCIDEFDKITEEDRGSVNEAMAQGTISPSKAGSNGNITLQADSSVLAAANPEHGRFDQYESIADQIDIQPSVLSRFDLVFVMSDKPDEEADDELAWTVLESYEGAQREERGEDMSGSDVAPEIDPELMQKYVAYAKEHAREPVLTDAAKTEIADFFKSLRSDWSTDDPVPVAPRELQALARLAVAHARIRLSERVEPCDAKRAIAITRKCLEDIGVDPETGEYDVDVVETGVSKSQHDRIKSLFKVVQDLEDEHPKGAPIEEVFEQMEILGVDQDKVEYQIDELKQQGDLYQPRNGYLRYTGN